MGQHSDDQPAEGNTPEDEESVKELFGRLIDDGTDLVRAELDHRRLLATRRIYEARPFIALGATGLAIAMAGLVATIMLLGLSLAEYMPLPVAAIVTASLACLAGYILARRAWINVSLLFAQAKADMAILQDAKLQNDEPA
ncbi:phage holin family protein [Aquisediminimonas sediminicola]|uniref:phage holin family protein n=1 Tax=Alteraquisediminimonas sediminicola TaxID=2676787 RepID=UPI001C8E4185|nr:phage holin family protein [Aquisediminimonas sediminicola]